VTIRRWPRRNQRAIDLVERDEGTELTPRHSGFPVGAARDAHGTGWRSTLNHLLDHVDARGTATTLTLRGDVCSTYRRTARMALAEKGLAYTMQTCGPHTPALLAVNPFGRTPVLRDGEIDLHETGALVRYLDQSFSAGTLLVASSVPGRTRCEQWVSAVNAYLYDAMARRYVLQCLCPKGAGGARDRTVIDAALKDIAAHLAVLDKAYGADDWLAGRALSMADLFVAPPRSPTQPAPPSRCARTARATAPTWRTRRSATGTGSS
jgi:glutathione S-transferase